MKLAKIEFGDIAEKLLIISAIALVLSVVGILVRGCFTLSFEETKSQPCICKCEEKP